MKVAFILWQWTWLELFYTPLAYTDIQQTRNFSSTDMKYHQENRRHYLRWLKSNKL